MKFVPLLAFILLAAGACKKDNNNPDPDPEPSDTTQYITIDKSRTYQEMIGFGGALTWYCDRVTSSPKKEEITDLMFKDLGADIIRLKNWYYPKDYPGVKSPATMEPNWFKNLFDATNELFKIAKAKDPNVKILLSSWSPPVALKSNGQLNTGTLKKRPDGTFMYDEFAQYWVDILDNITFNPDYLSIQNEPSYENTGWETCAWRDTEGPNHGGFDKAFDAVYNKIKDRPNRPILVAPESANISFAANGTSFHEFSNAIRNRSYLGVYGWHPYNFGKGTSIPSTVQLLERIKNEFSDRTNWMTEFSGSFDWFNTGRFINHTLVYANTSAYIYWELMWDENASNNAMIRIRGNGEYEVTPFYHLIKHFAKHIDRGYKRIGVGSSNEKIETSAFISPDAKKITVILLNTSDLIEDIKMKATSPAAKTMDTWISREGTGFYKQSLNLDPTTTLTLGPKSVTTVVLNY